MAFVLLRVFSIFLTVFTFSLITYVAWKKLIRPALHREKLEGEVVDASEAFAEKQNAQKAKKIREKGEV